ncbi:metal ABC transporter permease [Natronorubrum sp. A-ect3]|uniref:metal ABC transporter permease n=1 Tax=Natronorubrum sp. A-ect3 TaxID=3242698 RepID=UPI00359E8CC4
MSHDTNNPAEATDAAGESVGVRARLHAVGPSRTQLELGGIAATALLAMAMIAFITLDWLRGAPAWLGVAPHAEFLFSQFLIVGMWMDFYLGTNIFQHPFMWRAIATGVLIGIVAPLVGTYLVHRQMALIGETLAHTAFAGVAVGLIFVAFAEGTVLLAHVSNSGALILIAMVVSALGAIGLQWLTAKTNTYGDVPIAIVLSGSFAVGTLLISWGRERVSMAIDIEGFLFGSLTIVTVEGARMVAFLTIVVVAVIVLTYKQLLFITFDEQAARVARLNVDGYNTLLIVMTAVVVVGAMQILGVILVAAMLVLPVATASQIARSFRETLYLSVLFGQAAVIGGLAFAIWASLPPGGSIVVVAIGFYLLAIVLSDRSGMSISMH